MSSVAIIPARGGSKRVPRKNIKDFFGKPLIAYSIENALNSKLFKRVIVSTDDEEIATIAKLYGAEVPSLRAKSLSGDFVSSDDVIAYEIERLKAEGESYEYVCALYATAPLLKISYIKEGLEKLKNSNAIASFGATSMPFPIQRTFKINSSGECEMFTPQHYHTRSQDLEVAYQDAGAFYWSRFDTNAESLAFYKNSVAVILPRELVQDIDTLEDFRRAEYMYELLNRKKRVLFRADSSSELGVGHIMRDLVLASHYKNREIIFATRDLKGNINQKILEAGYKLHILKTNSKEELLALIKELKVEELVLDHYEIGYKFEKYLKTRSSVEILAFDDTYEKHYCDILLNHNINADITRYVSLVPPYCELRCGSKYTLLREEFFNEREKRRVRSPQKSILIAVGGSDYGNLNIKILKTVEKLSNIKVNVVTTKANKRLHTLKEFVKNREFVTLHVESKNIAKLMRKSDLAIVTPSVTLNEVHFMRLPFIAIKTAKNQEDMYQYLKERDFMALKKFSETKLLKLLAKVKI